MSKEPWYQDGLRFECTQCGNCCSGSPGYVWATEQERRRIAEHLGMDFDAFNKRYTKRVSGRYSLREKRNGAEWDCIFLDHVGGRRVCTIYDARPIQCRTWPFWSENLRTPAAWADAATGCPGMNRGKQVDFVDIEIQRTRKF